MSPRTDDTSTIGVVHPVCCGLDVHKKSIAASLIWIDKNGREQLEQKEFGTMTDDLISMRQWLLDYNCPVVAIDTNAQPKK